MPDLSVCFLPTDIVPEDVAGGSVVVVDILRASTTITHALAAGAAKVCPCLTIEDAVRMRARSAATTSEEGSWLLGGERKGRLIEGFDFGNSPTSYTPEAVGGKPIAFTTTNGTKALLRCRQADRILIGCFANLTAVADLLREDARPVYIVCAGTDGRVTAEDVLFAGALVQHLEGVSLLSLSDSARIARSFWNQSREPRDADWLVRCLQQSQGGRNLLKLGYDADVVTSAQIDTHPVVGHVAGDGCLYPLAPRPTATGSPCETG